MLIKATGLDYWIHNVYTTEHEHFSNNLKGLVSMLKPEKVSSTLFSIHKGTFSDPLMLNTMNKLTPLNQKDATSLKGKV